MKTSQQFVYLLIHIWAPVIDQQNWAMQKEYVTTLSDQVEHLTPTEFAQIFPITKEYKGRKWGVKDYFTVSDWIGENIGWNNRIPNGMEFLFEYLNNDVQVAAVKCMSIISKFSQRQTGKNPLIEFAKSQGIPIYRMGEDGELHKEE